MRPLTMTSSTRGPRARPVAPADAKAEPQLRLPADDVDVWRASLDDQPAEAVRLMHTLMSAGEVERARGFFFDRDRRRYIVGRGILRMLLGRYLGIAPHEVEFRYGPNGKPRLAGGTRAGVGAAPTFFNVAHSEGLALYAFTHVGEVGIDLELIRDLPDWEQVAEAAFSPHELALLRACPAERQREEFFRAWTRQEAVLKALGTGLGGATKPGNESGFNVHPLDVGPGFAAALAVGPAARRPTLILGWGGAAHESDPRSGNLPAAAAFTDGTNISAASNAGRSAPSAHLP